MIQLADKQRNALMEDIHFFDEQMTWIGVLRYDSAGHSFNSTVREKEITPQMVEDATKKGNPFSTIRRSRICTPWKGPGGLFPGRWNCVGVEWEIMSMRGRLGICH